MADHVYVQDLAGHVGQEVELAGWVYAKRSSGKLIFLELRDGTGIAQCVLFKPEVSPELFESSKHLGQEASVRVTGRVRAHERRPGEFEVALSAVQLIAQPAQEYPISPKDHGVDFLMDHRHLWLRSRRQHAILRVRAEIVAAIRDYFDSHGFTLIDAPIFTPSACEGTSTLFETDFHGDPVYLTQSGQLYMEAAAAAFGRAYCFGPTFRAEKSKTRRHLAEFWMVEPEVAFMDLQGDADLAEDFLVSVVSRVLDKRREELVTLERDTTALQRVQKPFPRIRYADAIKILEDAKHPGARYGDDFGGDEETVISSRFDRPVIVTHYPRSLKAFYFKSDPTDPGLALNMDVLAPEGYGEIVGGGQREDSLETLEKMIAEHKLPKEAFEWYLDLRRYGTFPHAGFGLGLERTVAWICGLEHVRETSPFPRMLTRIRP
jgi:asparaginyl-tRNA synthetase